MPCSDGYPSDYDIQLSKERAEIKRRLDLSTKLLCGVMRRLRRLSKSESDLQAVLVYQSLLGTDVYGAIPEVNGLRNWWINHQREDRERKKQEARRAHDDLASARKKVADLEKSLNIARDQMSNAKMRISKLKKGKK
ncbi:hypothetical protein EVB87_006 [Rhizobium phage RHph_N28_1]|nr:hypothetical protein EVB87_006 [Rhizobium phage RHph_N28_1]QIG74034.1 hypothetical protein EVC07_006 [Rhizobium phage RHph_N42]